MTIGELLQLYQRHHLAGKVSAPYYDRLIRQLFPPLLAFDVDALPKLVLLDWWHALSDRPGHANKALGLLRAAHRWATGLGLLHTPCPAAGIPKRPERTRSTTTSPDEWARMLPYLEDLRLKHRVYFWALYLLGSRPGEVRTMKPEHLHLDRAQPVWIKPTTKTGRPHVVPLPEQLVPIVRLLLRANPPDAQWVFWGETPDVVWCRTSAQKLWEGLRAKAGLSHLWLNDLRRSTASDLLNQGESLGIVQGALNHRSLSQTAKYAYLAVTPLAHALQDRTDRIVGCL
ncbi:MAG: tyrosine-type recombinase/integrase [Aestuariivirga sp.]